MATKNNKKINTQMSLEDYYSSMFGYEDGDANASALDEMPNTELDNDINGGPSMNAPEDLNDQDSQDDIQNSFHDGNTGDEQNGLEDDELFLNEDDSAYTDGGEETPVSDDSSALDTDETINTATDIAGDGTDITNETPVDETEIISDASEQEVPESAVDEANGDISNPSEMMESWFNNMSLEDLTVAISDGDSIEQEITIGDDGATTVQNNNNGGGSDSGDDNSSDSDSDSEGDDDLSDLDNDSDNDSDSEGDDDGDSSNDDEEDNDDDSSDGDKDGEDEENYNYFDEDFF